MEQRALRLLRGHEFTPSALLQFGEDHSALILPLGIPFALRQLRFVNHCTDVVMCVMCVIFVVHLVIHLEDLPPIVCGILYPDTPVPLLMWRHESTCYCTRRVNIMRGEARLSFVSAIGSRGRYCVVRGMARGSSLPGWHHVLKHNSTS